MGARLPDRASPSLKVVPLRPDPELVNTLVRLAEQANRGELSGLAYVAMYKGREYQGNAVGRAKSFPAYALGLLAALEAHLAALL
jgi:hypothetical protein